MQAQAASQTSRTELPALNTRTERATQHSARKNPRGLGLRGFFAGASVVLLTDSYLPIVGVMSSRGPLGSLSAPLTCGNGATAAAPVPLTVTLTNVTLVEPS